MTTMKGRPGATAWGATMFGMFVLLSAVTGSRVLAREPFAASAGAAADSEAAADAGAAADARAVALTLEEDPDDEDAWRFRLTPYFWATSFSIGGDLRGNPYDASLSFGDVLDDLGFAVLLAGEARNGNWSLNFNGDFLRLEGEEDGPAGGDVDVRLDGVIVEGTGGYRFAELDLGGAPASGAPASGARSALGFEALAGVRYYDLEVEADAGRAGGTSGSVDWLDLVVGALSVWSATDRLRIAARTDLCGFDIGGSRLSFQALGVIEYDLSDSLSLDLGYRYLSMGYEPSGASDTDLRLRVEGVLAGFSFRF